MKRAAFVITLAAGLAACGDREVLLPGERQDVRPRDALPEIAAATPSAPTAIALPAQVSLAAWPMRVGDADNDPGHAALSAAPQPVFSTRIGAGDSRRLRIAADPVTDGRLVYTLDARSSVTASAANGGGVVWSRSLVPAGEREGDAAGGGLAVVGGTLFATTGYGRLHALDAASGAPRWEQRLDAPVTAPKAEGGTVYVVSRDNRAWALDAATGRIRWDVTATPAAQAMATAPAPALDGRLVVLPFASAEVVAATRDDGIRAWGAAISGERRGVAYNDVGDITGDPVVTGGTVYAGTASGRIVSIDAATGARNWTAFEGAVSPMAVAGGSLFAVSDRNQLLRLDAASGAVVWRQDLPFFRARRLARRKGVTAHHGPVLAGGRLWVAGSDGQLRGFDPASGAQTAALPLPGGAASRPIVAGGVMYVVSRSGVLHAYR